MLLNMASTWGLRLGASNNPIVRYFDSQTACPFAKHSVRLNGISESIECNGTMGFQTSCAAILGGLGEGHSSADSDDDFPTLPN